MHLQPWSYRSGRWETGWRRSQPGLWILFPNCLLYSCAWEWHCSQPHLLDRPYRVLPSQSNPTGPESHPLKLPDILERPPSLVPHGGLRPPQSPPFLPPPLRSAPVRSGPIRSDPIRSDPIRSDPKAASKPSRQKQIPSSPDRMI